MSIFLHWADRLLGFDGVEFKFPLRFWHYWPKSSNDQGLMIFRNTLFHEFSNVSWHSTRQFPQYHTLRYRMLTAVCKSDFNEIERCLDEGWDINEAIDHGGKYNSASLAAHLDKLEVLHFLDLKGADISSPAG